MRHELYEIIKKMAIYCIVVSIGLTLGSLYVFFRVRVPGETLTTKGMIALATSMFGVVLCIAAIVVALVFSKKEAWQRQEDEAWLKEEESHTVTNEK